MNPYREPASRPVEVKHKPRGWWKTLQLKMLIWWKGTWKERFWRCPYCKTFVLPRQKGSTVIWSEPFFHMMRCSKASYEEQERHEKNYWFAVAPEPDEDFLGPLR